MTIKESIQAFTINNNITYEEAINLIEEYYQAGQERLHQELTQKVIV